MMYEAGVIDYQYDEAMEEIQSTLVSLESVDFNRSYDAMMEGFSVEGGKFELLVTYAERIYTSVMKLLHGIINFAKRMWLRVSLGVKNDKERDALINTLKKKKKGDFEITEELKSMVGKNMAYFFLKVIDGDVLRKDVNGILKESAHLRKGMLNGDAVDVGLSVDITQTTIGKDFVFNKPMKDYNEDLIYLGVNGMNAYLMATTKKDPVYGSGYRVVTAKLNKNPRWNAKALAKKTVSIENSIEELSDMMNAGELYNVLTKGLFDEMEAISHDLEADRLRMLKKMRSKSDGTLDDIKMHEASVKAKSNSARTMVGLSKALLQIGNGMLYDRKMRLTTAKLLVKQFGE